MSIVAAHPALAIWGSIIVAVCLAAYALLRLTDDRGRHTEVRQFEADLDDWQWHAAPTIDHDEYRVWADRNAGRFDSALGSPAHDHALASTGESAAGLPTLANPPDPPAGDEAPGPDDDPPEGDEPAARPPQGTTGPGDLLARAKAAIDALPVDGYLTHVHDATAYGDDGSLWNWVSDETNARGMAAIKAEVAP